MAPSYEPDDRLNKDLAKTTDHLIDRSKRLLAELDAELGRIRRSSSDDRDAHDQRRSA